MAGGTSSIGGLQEGLVALVTYFPFFTLFASIIVIILESESK